MIDLDFFLLVLFFFLLLLTMICWAKPNSISTRHLKDLDRIDEEKRERSLVPSNRFLPLVSNERVSDCAQSGNRLFLSLSFYGNRASGGDSSKASSAYVSIACREKPYDSIFFPLSFSLPLGLKRANDCSLQLVRIVHVFEHRHRLD